MRSHAPMIVWPGAARITLVLLAVVPAAMAYPWQSVRDRWLLAAAAAAAIVFLGWWRGRHVTTILRRRLATIRRNRGERPISGTDARITALLRVAAPATDSGVLPLPLIAGYLNRYGVRAGAIRVTSRDTEASGRETWIGLTFSAADNLAALRARSPRISLRRTADVTARRLVDHLREIGWTASTAAPEDIPPLIVPTAPETWRAVRQGNADYVAAYRVSVKNALSETLAEIWSYRARETWTALEIAASGTRRTIAVACAYRTDERPDGAAPCAGLTAQHGNHRPVLRALHPLSTQHLDGHTELPANLVLRWPTAQVPVSTAPVPTGPRHAAATS